jgi:outer membrane lipoprotein-sorting protein
MRYALLALLFPAVAWAGEGNEAEKLFRQMEKKISGAKALRIVADIKGTAKGTDVSFHVTMTLAEGNKARVKMKGEVKKGEKTEKFGAELISDGTKLHMTETTSGKEKEEKTPERFSQKLTLLVGRVGILGGLRTGVGGKKGAKAPDLEKLVSLKDFKMGEPTKVNGRDARVLHYQATIAGANIEDEPKVKIALYVDAKTLLPLKRTFVIEKEEGRLTETYTEFTLNPKIDPKLFELPK